uniref:Uncharacterized protein n=1 Tax=Ralstonia solanacearum TaxID=305 RepID=A0A0S4TUX7_RALSL|nr:protein of unknown function [Ralstonia solanacearum]
MCAASWRARAGGRHDQAGEPLFRADCMRRVTPQHLRMLAPLNQQASANALL